MKKVISLFLSIVMLISTIACVDLSAYANTSGDYEYTVLSDGTAEITTYNGSDAEITIPSRFGKYTVTSIGNYAFKDSETLISVQLPNSIVNIGKMAFYNCLRLMEINLQEGIVHIGNSAFSDCFLLTQIIIPNSVKYIGSWVFDDSYRLTNVIMPENLEAIGYNCFLNTGIYNDSSNWIDGAFYVGNVLVDTDKEYLPSKYNVKNGTKIIAPQAFNGNDNLKEVYISDGVTVIGENAFENCVNLSNIYIPKSVKELVCDMTDPFYNCNKLNDVYYSGTKEEWDKIKGSYLCLENATIHYNSTSPELVKEQTFNEYFSNDIINNYNYINSTEGPAGPLMDDAWDINKLANGFVQSISHFGNGKTTEENIQEYYDAVLYDLISNTYSLPNFDSYMQKRFIKIKDEMIDYFIGKGFAITSTVKEADLGTFYNYVQEFIGANQSNYELTYDLVNSVADGFRDGTECIEKLSQYMVLKEEGAKLEGALKLMLQNAENNTLKKAVNDVINSISMTPQQYMNYVVADKMKEYGVSTIEKVATKIFEEIIVTGFKMVFPFAEVKLIADITNCLTETFFATTTNSNQQYRLYIYIQVEESCKKSITSAKNTYQINNSETNAATLVSCYDMYLRIYEHEVKECLNLADIYYNQGVFNKIKNKLFNNGKNYQSAVDWINSYNYDLEKLQELEQSSYEKWGIEKGIIKKVYVFVLVNDTVAAYNDYNVNTGEPFNIPSMQDVISTLKKATGYDVVTNGNYYDRQLKNRIIGGSFKVNNNTAVFVDMDLVKRTLTKSTTSKDGCLVTIDALTNKQLYKTVIPKANNIKLNSSSYTYSGKMITPKVTLKNSKGYTLKEGTDYKLTYSIGRKNVGKYSVKITFKGNYSGSKTLYFTIKPKATSISKLTASKKAFTVKWKKQSIQTTGYQIQYSTSSKFKAAKTITVSKNSTTSKRISKLKAKKKYYVRIRTYKTVKGTKYYSTWSKTKSVTTKK